MGVLSKRIMSLVPIVAIFFITFFLGINSWSEENETADKNKDFEQRVHEEVRKRLVEVKKKSIVDISKELLDRERKLDLREKKLQAKEEKMAITEKSLRDKIAQFNKRQQSIIGCINENKERQQSRIQQLVNVVSNMKPNKAAELLSVQDHNISVQIMSKLEAERASKIFNVMDKEISARLQKAYLHMEK